MKEGLTFAGYENHVVTSRFSQELDRDWKMTYSNYLDSESLEMLTQHGNGMLLLMPFQMEMVDAFFPSPEAKQELQYAMADEMGDIVWFTFDVATHNRLSISDTCSSALKGFGVETELPIDTFSDIENYAINHADKIKVLNKRGLYGLDIPELQKYTSLDQNPQYLLLRTSRRLSRSLDRGSKDMAPFTASEIECPVELEQAIGEYLLVLAYIAKQRLGVSLEEVAQFNMAKLVHRQQFGKEFDLKFAAWKHAVESEKLS